MAECNHSHDEDSYVSGPRYRVTFYTKDGVMLSSTPMMGEDANKLMVDLHQHFAGARSELIEEKEARELLLKDAARWKEAAVSIEDNLVDHHAGFQKNAKEAWGFAKRLEELANMVSD